MFEKTLGIVGLGSSVARIAYGFNMRVFAYDPYVNIESAKKIVAELVDLEKLPKESNLVTLHLVLTKNTRCMISTGELNLAKPVVYLINASRGPIVDDSLDQSMEREQN